MLSIVPPSIKMDKDHRGKDKNLYIIGAGEEPRDRPKRELAPGVEYNRNKDIRQLPEAEVERKIREDPKNKK